MGGHIALRYLHDFPATFDAAAMSAPMIAIKGRGGIPVWAGRALAMIARNFGFAEAYVPGGGDWTYKPNYRVEDSNVSQDPRRFRVAQDYQALKPELQLGSATFGWLNNAFRSITLINDESYLKAIRIPLLIGTPQFEQVVEPAAQDRACGLIPRCEQVRFDGAKHEIWMEKDEFRQQWLAAIDRFLAARLRR
jgi:lysophospholipase